MRVLVVTQYFWPEYFRINDVVKYLREKKYNVDVLTGIPNYPLGSIFKDFKLNKANYHDYYGAKIYRVPIYLRRNSNKFNLFINYISYVISACVIGFFIIRKKNSYINHELLNFIENIMHYQECKNSVYINYSISRLIQLLSNEKINS